MAALTTFTGALTEAQADSLRAALQTRGFDFKEKPHTLYAASKDKLQVSVYEKGPKVLVQGKGTEEFVKYVLEPEIFREIRVGYEEERFPERFVPHFGIDESGKGDFFGPLVVAGVYTDAAITRALIDLGVCDSKRIGSDRRVRELAGAIRKVPGLAWEVVTLTPDRYNELHGKVGNVNRLLAWAHVVVMQKLAARFPDCRRALSDQFADRRLLEMVAKKKQFDLQIDQRPRAEDDPAVAAASILAREGFIDWLDAASQRLGERLPRGSGLSVQALARELAERLGPSHLREIGKTHFRFVSGAS